MIERDFIVAWRQHAPWPTDAQVEQDLVLSRALIEMFNHPLLSRELAFRDGTALHKLFLPKPARYSEDIDLVQVAQAPIGPVMTALRETLDPWLGKPKRTQGEGRMTFLYRFESELPPIVPLRLKIEINTREHFAVFGYETRTRQVESGWFRGTAEVRSYRFEELLGTKLRALYQRKKGRDLFDLGVVLENDAIDTSALVTCFEEYMTRGGCVVPFRRAASGGAGSQEVGCPTQGRALARISRGTVTRPGQPAGEGSRWILALDIEQGARRGFHLRRDGIPQPLLLFEGGDLGGEQVLGEDQLAHGGDAGLARTAESDLLCGGGLA